MPLATDISCIRLRKHSIRSLEQGGLAPRSHAIAAGLEATERPYIEMWTCHRCKPVVGCIERLGVTLSLLLAAIRAP